MTLEEVAMRLGKSEITLKTKFKRTQENLKKKGILLIKTGYGDKADYQIIYEKEIKKKMSNYPTIQEVSIEQFEAMSEEKKIEFYTRIVKANPLTRDPDKLRYKTFERKRKTAAMKTRGEHQPDPGRLTFIGEVCRSDVASPKVFYLCLCDCGNWYITRADIFNKGVSNGGSFSCGCLNKEVYTEILNSKETIEKRANSLRSTLMEEGRIPQAGEILFNWKITASERRTAPNNPSGRVKRYIKGICPMCQNESDWIRFDGIQSGAVISCGCHDTFHSIPSELIRQLLTEAGISFVTEKSFEDCRFPSTGYKAKFDFYVENKYLIEYDGEQHFKRGFGNSELEFKQLQARDAFKTQWCEENNIPLIRIPCTHKEDIVLEDLLLETSNFIVNQKLS